MATKILPAKTVSIFSKVVLGMKDDDSLHYITDTDWPSILIWLRISFAKWQLGGYVRYCTYSTILYTLAYAFSIFLLVFDIREG